MRTHGSETWNENANANENENANGNADVKPWLAIPRRTAETGMQGEAR
jgi:arabinogalactan endo-1,4-beta-galactosidase